FLRPNPSLSCLSPLSLHDALPILRRHARPPARRTNLKHHSQRGSRERSGSTRSQSMSFESLGLLPELTRALSAQGYESPTAIQRSEEHTSELQSRENLVCRLLLEK